MELKKAEQLAIELLKKHNLFPNCQFKWINAVCKAGHCRFYFWGSPQHIALSKTIAKVADENFVRTVILHEIAHALAGRGEGHGYKWRRICLSIGGDGKRCYDRELLSNLPEKQWQGVCEKCGRKVERYRKQSNAFVCGRCGGELNWTKV